MPDHRAWRAVAGLALLAVALLLAGGAGPVRFPGGHARALNLALETIRQRSYDPAPDSALYLGAIRGMLETLHDPYSELLMGAARDEYWSRVSGMSTGIGFTVAVRDGWITVLGTNPESPAGRAGIRDGDRLLTINGRPVRNWGVPRVTQALQGTPGVVLSLSLRRGGLAQPLELRLRRAEFRRSVVSPGVFLEGEIGYVALTAVSEGSATALEQAIDGLYTRGMRRLILDLRSNPGGLLREGARIAELFLGPGAVIGMVWSQVEAMPTPILDQTPERWPDLRIAVLVNRGTASSAELIAGALQDHGRAAVLGTATYGKGLIQTVFPLGDAVAIKLTTSRWLTPRGRDIQRAPPGRPPRFQGPNAGQALSPTGAPRGTKLAQCLGVLPEASGIIPDIAVPATPSPASETPPGSADPRPRFFQEDSQLQAALDLLRRNSFVPRCGSSGHP